MRSRSICRWYICGECTYCNQASVYHGYKFLDGKTGVEPEESGFRVASVELGHVQVLEGQEVDTSSSSPNYVEHLLAIIVLQVPQVIQYALLKNQHTPHLLQCLFHHQFLVTQQLPVSMVCLLGQALKMSKKLNAARSVMPFKCQIC
ncbi:unnamed protein product [Sphagnum jensenii]|uniref:Uncharacterized protein n=1 Tax=Sphagnum jensenii TaxID=128206 RepID=A0ABP1BRW6_9BRYO